MAVRWWRVQQRVATTYDEALILDEKLQHKPRGAFITKPTLDFQRNKKKNDPLEGGVEEFPFYLRTCNCQKRYPPKLTQYPSPLKFTYEFDYRDSYLSLFNETFPTVTQATPHINIIKLCAIEGSNFSIFCQRRKTQWACDGEVVYDEVDTEGDGGRWTLGSTNVGNYVGCRQFNLARGRTRKGVAGLKFTVSRSSSKLEHHNLLKTKKNLTQDLYCVMFRELTSSKTNIPKLSGFLAPATTGSRSNMLRR
ncbi:hypothetical protein QTP88_014025 [Uroleucon formosanum]